MCYLFQLSIDSPVSPSTVILPLVFVVSVTMCKQVRSIQYVLLQATKRVTPTYGAIPRLNGPFSGEDAHEVTRLSWG